MGLSLKHWLHWSELGIRSEKPSASYVTNPSLAHSVPIQPSPSASQYHLLCSEMNLKSLPLQSKLKPIQVQVLASLEPVPEVSSEVRHKESLFQALPVWAVPGHGGEVGGGVGVNMPLSLPNDVLEKPTPAVFWNVWNQVLVQVHHRAGSDLCVSGFGSGNWIWYWPVQDLQGFCNVSNNFFCNRFCSMF